jgi:hypothetical protein
MRRPIFIPRTLPKFALRLIAAWILISALGYWMGGAVMQAHAPAIAATVQWLLPYGAAKITTNESEQQLVLDLRVDIPIAVSPSRFVPRTTLSTHTHVIHALVPLVIFWTVLLAVPIATWRERGLSLCLGIAFGIALVLLTTPFQLAGLIEISLQRATAQAGLVRVEPLALKWMLLMEGGGRWALPLAGALLCRALTRYLLSRKAERIAPDKSDYRVANSNPR